MELDDAIRQIWSEFHDSQSGRTRWKEMAERLTEMSVKTSTGKEFNKDSLWTYVKRHRPVNITVAGRRAGKVKETVKVTAQGKTETVNEDAPLPSREAKSGTVDTTATSGNPGTTEQIRVVDLTRQEAVTATADIPSQQPVGTIWQTVDGERIYALGLGEKEFRTFLELLDWFRTQQGHEAPKALPEPFPEAMPCYDGKVKDSVVLVPERYKRALELAHKIWPKQKPGKSDLIMWLIERFISEAERLADAD